MQNNEGKLKSEHRGCYEHYKLLLKPYVKHFYPRFSISYFYE